MEKAKKLLHNKIVQESLLFFILAAALLIYALRGQYEGASAPWKLSPYLFPTLVGVLLLASAASLLREGIHASRAESGKGKTEEKPNLRGVFAVVGGAIVYCILMPVVGFLSSTALFLAGLIFYLGERRAGLIAVTAVSCSVLCYLVFDVLLRVMLP
ncbi:MAG: tripartite tricarboxylate transporter TctB family protein [Angelakisella sp.]